MIASAGVQSWNWKNMLITLEVQRSTWTQGWYFLKYITGFMICYVKDWGDVYDLQLESAVSNCAVHCHMMTSRQQFRMNKLACRFHLISCIKTTHQTTADRGHLQSRYPIPIYINMEENPALATWWPVNYQAAQTSPKTESWCRAKLPEICGGCGKWAHGATHAVGREAAWHVPKTSKSSEGRLGYVGVHVSVKCV